MPIESFTADDFRVFDIPGFAERMAAIRSRLRPKLEAVGATITPALTRLAERAVFPHVAKHARRTVNPPDDTWVAFAGDRRGYKKSVHFKVAISRHCLRFLFEVGPEYADKPAFAAAWKRDASRLARKLGQHPDLGWYRNEHDEEPAGALRQLDADGLARLAEELMRRRDGQLVLGRRVEAREAAKWRGSELEKAVLDTFATLGDCYRRGRGRRVAGENTS